MKLTLIFRSLKELEWYLETIVRNDLTEDYNNLSLTGNFEEREIEFAEHIFQAVVIETK